MWDEITYPFLNFNGAMVHTTDLHTTQRFGGVLSLVVCSLSRQQCRLAQRRYYRPVVGLTFAQPTMLSDWLGCDEGYTQPSQHTTEPLGCVQLGGVPLGCIDGYPCICAEGSTWTWGRCVQ